LAARHWHLPAQRLAAGAAKNRRVGGKLLPQLRHEIIVIVAAVGIGQLDRALIRRVPDASNQQQRFGLLSVPRLNPYLARPQQFPVSGSDTFYKRNNNSDNNRLI